MSAIPSATGAKERRVYDMEERPQWYMPGKLVRSEKEGASGDPAVDEAFDYSGEVYDFYLKLFRRNSLDNKGMVLISSVHIGKRFNNAFWNGEQMAYGDGDGRIFTRFTGSLDVVAHELTHGVVTHTCNLEYDRESGALNEHLADVFGLLVKQRSLGHDVLTADWLVGKEITVPRATAKALRTFKDEPAYENDPYLGTDPQPKHMRDKYNGDEDYGGVHINSGILNHAFFLVASAIGGNAWEQAGSIWYHSMLALNSQSNFAEMARTTTEIAERNYGVKSREHRAVSDAWKAVGL